MENRIYNQDSYQKTCDATVVDIIDQMIFLDQTVFFAQGGGQAGDVGFINWQDKQIEVLNSVKDKASGRVAHLVPLGHIMPNVGDAVTLEINWDRRYKLMRMHTCLHLLCNVIKGDVTGGQIEADKGRLDFDLSEFLLTKDEIADALNKLIEQSHPIETYWIGEDVLQQRPELVRTKSVMPPSKDGKIRMVQIGEASNLVDLQPCGGTHVKLTSEIGAVRVGKIQNKGKNNRRINIHFVE